MRFRNFQVTKRLLGLALGALAVGPSCGEERPPVWSYISPAIIQPNCATSSCHSRLTAVAGLDLSEIDRGYASLMRQKLPDDGVRVRGNYNAGMGSPRALVAPGNPHGSRIVTMMRGIGTSLMPPDRGLAEADIQLIERWIANEAHND